MNFRRSPCVAMALYFLVRAGAGHASETTDVSLLPTGDENQGELTLLTGHEALDSAPIELSQLALTRIDLQLAIDSTDEVEVEPAEAGTIGESPAVTNDGVEPAAIEHTVPAFAGDHDPIDDEASWGSDAALARADAASAADAGDEAIFASGSVELASDAELAGQRGGFVYQGIDIRLGAEVRSYIGDEMVIQTNFSWTDTQLEVERIVSTELTPGALAGLQAGMLSGSGLNLRGVDDAVYLANEGQTAFIQRTEGTLQNIVINSASNVAIRQEIQAELNLSNFAPFRADALSDRIISALSGMAGWIPR